MYQPESIEAKWAWEVLNAFFEKREPGIDEDIHELDRQAACFVTLHNNDGSLRGCIGTITPRAENLKQEIKENALSAALSDPRFKPLQKEELGNINISVDVLQQPEYVDALSELDPKVYGVIVFAEGKQGVLLPNLETVDTVEKQLSIAMQKAGITPGAPINVERFKVIRYH